MPYTYDEPRPFGKLTRRHVASMPECPFGDPIALGVYLSTPKERGEPTLIPIMKVHGSHLYDEDDVLKFFAAVRKWREESPQRRGAKRRAEEAAMAAKTAEEMRRMSIQQEILKSDGAAQEQHENDRQAWLRAQG